MWAKTLGSVVANHVTTAAFLMNFDFMPQITAKPERGKDWRIVSKFSIREREFRFPFLSLSLSLALSLSRSKYVYYLNMGSDGISMCVREKSKRLNRASCWLVRYLWISYCYRKSVFSPVVSEFLFLYEMNGFRLPSSGPSQQKSKIKFELIWPFVWLENLKLPKIVGHFTKTKYRHRHRHTHI